MEAFVVHPKRVVSDGYDQIAETYAAWTARSQDDPRERYTALLLDRLPAGARLLDLGCGSGVPTTKRLAERFAVTGVDGSARQVALARRQVPNAIFLQADMTALDFPPASFDAVTAFYSITHLPREEHGALLRSIAGWLRPGGLLVATMGAADSPGAVEDDWLGTAMYFSHYDGETNRRLVEDAGLQLISARDEITDEDGVPVTFIWIVAQKPA